METKNLEQVKELINRIADYYDLPTEEQTEEMRKLTGMDWSAEDLQMQCCEYWSQNSLEETAYLMFHGDYPPVHEVDLIFWKYKPGVVMDDQAVFNKYRLGKGTLKALEALPLDEILQKINKLFSGWQQNNPVSDDRNWRFDCLVQTEYWMDTHFWIFEYRRETDLQREHISYIQTGQGVLYLSMIRDLYDNSIVAYKTATHQTVDLVLETIRLAIRKRASNQS